MTGPPVRIHVDPLTSPTAVHTPTTVPLHWQEEVEQQLNDDVSLVEKADGTPRWTCLH